MSDTIQHDLSNASNILDTFIKEHAPQKPVLFRALSEWNPWWDSGKVPPAIEGVPRRLGADLIDSLESRAVTLLAGVRRSGKTTAMYQLVGRLIREGVPTKQILYANMEDSALLAPSLDEILSTFRQSMNPKGRIYLFLDEVQAKAEWERWVLREYEQRKPVKVVATGSSSTLLRGERASLLVGRNLAFEIAPLRFREYLEFRREEPVTANIRPRAPVSPERTDALIHHLDSYLEVGGFPGVVLQDATHHRTTLDGYFHDILYRDIIRRTHADAARITALAVHLLTTIGSLLSLRKLARATGVSPESIRTYLGYLEECYLVRTVPMFTRSSRSGLEERYPRKVYAVDTGLRNRVVQRSGQDRGSLAENLVANELARRFRFVSYWKGKREVDFVVRRQDGRYLAFNVWYGDPGERIIPQREAEGMDEILATLGTGRGGVAEATILTRNREGRIGDDRIQLVPLWSWLLSDGTLPSKGADGKTRRSSRTA